MVKIHFIFRESAVNCIGRAKRALSRAPEGRLRSSLQHSARSSYDFIIRRINRVGREPMQSLNRGVLFAQNCAFGALFGAKNTPMYPNLKVLIMFFICIRVCSKPEGWREATRSRKPAFLKVWRAAREATEPNGGRAITSAGAIAHRNRAPPFKNTNGAGAKKFVFCVCTTTHTQSASVSQCQV